MAYRFLATFAIEMRNIDDPTYFFSVVTSSLTHCLQERELQKQLIQLQAQYNQSLEERKEKEAMVRDIL